MNLSFVYQNLNIISFRLQNYEFNFKISKISVYLTFNRLFVLFLNIKRRYFIHFSMVNILSFSRFPKI